MIRHLRQLPNDFLIFRKFTDILLLNRPPLIEEVSEIGTTSQVLIKIFRFSNCSQLNDCQSVVQIVIERKDLAQGVEEQG